MNVSLQNIDKVSAQLTVKLEKADYQEKVDKSLKSFRQKAQMPGFRKGMVPMSLVKKMYGKSVIAEEVNKVLQEAVYNYIKENKVNMLGEPLPNEEKQQVIDFDTMEEFEFVFDIALAPEFKAEVSAKDKVDYYTIEVSDEMIENQSVVSAFSYNEKAKEEFDVLNDRLADSSLKATFYSSITNPTTRFVNSLIYSGVGVAGAILAIFGGITVGGLTSFLGYASQYAKPFNEISGVVTELQNAIACAARIFEIIDAPAVEESRVNHLSDVAGKIVFEDVAFSYDPSKPLIEHLNLTVEPGQRIAIVGPTGSGKTTLINLLMRFYDTTHGKITIDGVDIRSIPRANLREKFGMVLQETWLKEGTIRENLLFANPDATEEEMVQAARTSHAHEFIKRLPNGYDTYIKGDDGSLSQGEKQLLCIARLMLALPPMLILDEATSSIDTRTEMKIQEAFQTMMEGRTTFVVAHRLSTIREADVILYMQDGKVLEQGNHQELLEKNGYYAKLYRSQFVCGK